jgi:hypothetical protein
MLIESLGVHRRSNCFVQSHFGREIAALSKACRIASIRILACTIQPFCLQSISPSHDSSLIHVQQASLNVFIPFPECERTCFFAVEPRKCVLLGNSTSSNIKLSVYFMLGGWFSSHAATIRKGIKSTPALPYGWFLRRKSGYFLLVYSGETPLLSTVIPCFHFTIRASVSFTDFSLSPQIW